jgi:hypothetical protein
VACAEAATVARHHRADEHDAAVLAPAHGRQRGLAAVVDALEVDRQHAVPFGLGDLGERDGLRDAGVGHQDVRLAQLAGHLCIHRVDIGAHGHIGAQRQGTAAASADRPGQFLDAVGLHVRDGHGDAAVGQGEGGRPADAARGRCAGDHGHMAIRVGHLRKLFRVGDGRRRRLLGDADSGRWEGPGGNTVFIGEP